MLDNGGNGKDIARTSVTSVTTTSLCYPLTNRSSSSEHSSTPIELPTGNPRTDLQALTKSQWSQILGNISGKAPLHLPRSSNVRPFVRMWFKACDNGDPPKRQQRAITSQFLRSMYGRSGGGPNGVNDSEAAIVAEIAIVAYFFACHALLRDNGVAGTGEDQDHSTQWSHFPAATERWITSRKTSRRHAESRSRSRTRRTV